MFSFANPDRFVQVKGWFIDQNSASIQKYFYIGLEKGECDLEDFLKKYSNNNSSSSSSSSLDWETRVRICFEIAQSLQIIHSYGLVYRDLKTPNIIVFDSSKNTSSNNSSINNNSNNSNSSKENSNYSFKLADFGTITLTGNSTINIGTKGWISLEQALEANREQKGIKLTEKSDIYTFGLIMYCILTEKSNLNPLKVNQIEIVKHAIENPAKIESLTEFSDPDEEEDGKGGKLYPIPKLQEEIENIISRNQDQENAKKQKKFFGLMKQCFRVNPNARPDTEQVLGELKECF